jgi:hypothetical protein
MRLSQHLLPISGPWHFLHFKDMFGARRVESGPVAPPPLANGV